ncbi:MAG: dinitrogenase iron-molybdenum cofactor [Firmicutes bacterium]|nr:dinitrogenase iron-molybdenum cofactor [Bacillota bacterium]
MKIAIATDNGYVAQHFGHCATYTLFELEDNRVIGKEIIDNPGHQPGFLPGFLAQFGVSCIIAGGMGQRAQQLFAGQGIDTVVGVTGPVDQVISAYLDGNLQSGESLCDHKYRQNNCSKER